MNTSFLIRGSIISILVLVIFGSMGLVLDEYHNGKVCPTILSIPACYIVMFCFVGALIGECISKPILLHSLVGLVLLIASYGSLGEIFGYASCPRTSGGIPMCYISWSICSLLLILSFVRHRVTDENKAL